MRKFDQRFIHFETPEGAVVEDAGLSGMGGEPPVSEPAVEPAATAPEIPEWGQTLGDTLTQMGQRQEELIHALYQPEEQQPVGDPAMPEWDPLDPQSVDRYIEAKAEGLLEQRWNERFEPFEHVLGTVAEREGETIARGQFEKIQAEIGKFDHDQALALTQSLISAGAEPMQAVVAAARRQHEFEQGFRSAVVKEHEEHLRTLGTLPPEPPAATAGNAAVEQPAAPQNAHEAAQGGPSRYEEIGRALLERRTPQTTV